MGLGQTFPEPGGQRSGMPGHDHSFQLIRPRFKELGIPALEPRGFLPRDGPGSGPDGVVQPKLQKFLPRSLKQFMPKGAQIIRIPQDGKIPALALPGHPLLDRSPYRKGNQRQTDHPGNHLPAGRFISFGVSREDVHKTQENRQGHQKGRQMDRGIFQGKFVRAVAVASRDKDGRPTK